jgi:hypothetical protein
MGKHRWLKIECLHRVDNLESERLKVAALNLIHPIASPLFKNPYFHVATEAAKGEGGEGTEVFQIDGWTDKGVVVKAWFGCS